MIWLGLRGFAVFLLLIPTAASSSSWTPLPNSAGNYIDLHGVRRENFPSPKHLTPQSYYVARIRIDAQRVFYTSETVFDCEGHYATMTQTTPTGFKGTPSFDQSELFHRRGPRFVPVELGPDNMMVDAQALVCPSK
jgi:hypothetical protein